MPAHDPEATAFVAWFTANGGWIDAGCELQQVPGMGRGLVATRTFTENERVFSIPRRILVNLGTSKLESACQAAEATQPPKGLAWSELVERGWCPLILMLLYEHWRAKHGAEPSWGPYFDVMPSKFDTPMFWTPQEVEELAGTDVMDKIGHEDAERDYHECVLPYVQQYPEVFVGTTGEEASGKIAEFYSLPMYHRMGSSILSRSFHVKRDLKHAEADDADIHSMPAEVSVQRDIPGEVEGDEEADESLGVEAEDDDEEEDGEEEEEDDEDVRDISMVPMADMLNARFGSENTRLFYKREVLEMRCTKPVEVGEQMLNTYGNPPNSDLLRRYGFVDEPNRGDLVELPAELVVDAAVAQIVEATGAPQADVESLAAARFEWACTELGMDEAFLLPRLSKPEDVAPYGSTLALDPTQPAAPQKKALSRAAAHIPEDLMSFARLLCMPAAGYAKAQKRSALPNARLDAVETPDVPGPRVTADAPVHLRVASVLLAVVEKRLAAYPSDWAHTAEALRTCTLPGAAPQRMALVVRAGDETILTEHAAVLRLALAHEATERAPRADAGKKARTA